MKSTLQHKRQHHRNKILHLFTYFFLPAAGPRAFVSSGFEQLMLEQLQTIDQGADGQVWHLVAGSTGALRALALITSTISNQDHSRLLKDQFCEMYYCNGMTGLDLHPMMVEAFHIAAPSNLLPQALGHSRLRVAIMVCRIRYFTWMPTILLRLVFLLLWGLNLFSHKLLSLFVERLCFYSGPCPPKDLETDTPVTFIPLTKENTHQVLHATTSIPFISKPCTFISGLGCGIFLDAGVTDYYLNASLKRRDSELADEHADGIHGLLLADIEPSAKRIPRSALDTFNPFFSLGAHRQTDLRFSRICKIRPSPRFVESLPAAKLPSVKDWFNPVFIRDPTKRHESWNHAFELSRREWPRAFLDSMTTFTNKYC